MGKFKIVRYLVLTAFVILILFPIETFASGHSVAICGGIEASYACGTYNFCYCCDCDEGSPNLVYPDGRLNAGNCVWYVWNRRCDAGEAFPTCLNANLWDTEARYAGWPVCNCPKIGAIAVHEAGTYGHVAIVTNYDGGNVWVDEQGCGFCGTFSNEQYNREYWDHYIYFRNDSCQSAKFAAGDLVKSTDVL